MKFIHEDDRDFLIEKEDPPEDAFAQLVPTKPVHAPRCMMTVAIYEMLCQAYSYVNSTAYRNASGEAGRARELRTLTLERVSKPTATSARSTSNETVIKSAKPAFRAEAMAAGEALDGDGSVCVVCMESSGTDSL